MQRLHMSGLRVWLLSGDRQENAVSVARASGLLAPEEPLLLLPEASQDESKAIAKEHVQSFMTEKLSGRCHAAALVLAGATVGQCKECEWLQADVVQLISSVRTVICYRVRNNNNLITTYVQPAFTATKQQAIRVHRATSANRMLSILNRSL